MRILLILSIICLSGCNSPANIDDRVNELVDSLDNENSIVSFHQKDMGDYWLYTISNEIGPLYDEIGNLTVSEIRNIGDKDILVYSSTGTSKNIDRDKVTKVDSCYTMPHHTIIWYFAITKDGKREKLVQPANSSVMPYEIPSIRNFMNPSKEIKDYEYIMDYITIRTDDSLQTTDIYIIARLYNRQGKEEKAFHTFSFVCADDTLQFKVDTLSLSSSYIDDTLWAQDPYLTGRYDLQLELQGKENLFKQPDRETIRKILEESISVESEEDNIEVLIPSEAEIYLQENDIWKEFK